MQSLVRLKHAWKQKREHNWTFTSCVDPDIPLSAFEEEEEECLYCHCILQYNDIGELLQWGASYFKQLYPQNAQSHLNT